MLVHQWVVTIWRNPENGGISKSSKIYHHSSIETHGFGDSPFQEPPILQNPVQMKQPTSCFPIRAEALDDLIVFEIRYSDRVGHRDK